MARMNIWWFWFPVLCWGALLPAQEASTALVDADEVSGNEIRAYLGLGNEASGVDTVWSKSRWQAVVKIADEMIEADKKSHGGHALKYLALLELKGDRMLASQAAVRATKDLAESPKAMGEFINRALYVAPRVNEYQLALMALVPLVPDARNVASVRVAYLRALVGCGKVKEAVATNRDIVKDLGGNAEDLLTLLRGICDMNTKRGKPLGAIARQALDQVLKTRERDIAIRMLEYQILHGFEENKKAAHDLGAKIIEEGANSQTLNNWLWYLITRRSTAGKYPALALQAARQLMEQNPSPYQLDTIALALYQNGMFDEALDFQKRAVAGGGASTGMQRRLKIFRAAKAKRDKGKEKEKVEAKK